MPTVFELNDFYQNINVDGEVNKIDVGHFDIFKIAEMHLTKQRKETYPRKSFLR